MSMEDFSKRTQQLETFLSKRGVTISPRAAIADFRSSGQGRGVIALADIEEGDIICSIPQNALLRADQDEKLSKLVKKHDIDSWAALMLRMMLVQNSPEWAPYFNVLPREFNTPMFWPKQKTQTLLKGSEVVSLIGREEADMLYDFLADSVLKDPHFEHCDTTRETFHIMGSLIMSYAFDIPREVGEHDSEADEEEADDNDEDEDDEVKAMIPLADIFNSHTKLQNARLTIPESSEGDYEMIASKPIRKGEQIYNIYGNQPSSAMLRRYGFVETGGTSYEIVEIELDMILAKAGTLLQMSKTDLKRQMKLATKKMDVPPSFEISFEDIDGQPELEIDPEMLALANILVGSAKGHEEVDPRAAELLKAVIKERQEQYEPLPSQPEPTNTQALVNTEEMCAQVVLAEYEVLNMALSFLAEDDVQTPNKKQRV